MLERGVSLGTLRNFVRECSRSQRILSNIGSMYSTDLCMSMCKLSCIASYNLRCMRDQSFTHWNPQCTYCIVGPTAACTSSVLGAGRSGYRVRPYRVHSLDSHTVPWYTVHVASNASTRCDARIMVRMESRWRVR